MQYQPFESTVDDLRPALRQPARRQRHEEFLEAISFARETVGQRPARHRPPHRRRSTPATRWSQGTFNDVDLRVEQRRDNLETEFFQNAFLLEHEFSSALRGELRLGHTRAVQYNPNQTTLSFEHYDTDGYAYDYSNPNLPAFTYRLRRHRPGQLAVLVRPPRWVTPR